MKNDKILATGHDILVPDPRISITNDSLDDFSLTIENVKLTDEATYQCLLQIFPPQYKDVTLKVYG